MCLSFFFSEATSRSSQQQNGKSYSCSIVHLTILLILDLFTQVCLLVLTLVCLRRTLDLYLVIL